jgi:hypothetical protein
MALPEPGETLLLYIAATTQVVSATLVVEREEPEHIYKVQRMIYYIIKVSHPVFKTKTRCSSYVCPGSGCHTYGQNVSTEYQCLYYIVSYYKNLLLVPKGLNSGMDPILPQAVDRGFRMPRRNLHPHTPHLLSSRT